MWYSKHFKAISPSDRTHVTNTNNAQPRRQGVIKRTIGRQPRRQGVIKRTIGRWLARSWPPPLPRHRCSCVLLLLLLGLYAAAAANISLLSCCVCVQCLGNLRLLCACTQHASCGSLRQRAAAKARSHETDDRKLALCRKRDGAIWPQISPWVSATGCTRGESGRLVPRRPKLLARNERKHLGEQVLLVFSCGITERVRERTVRTLILTNSNTY